MANPTTNFGWVMPTATDLVTDLPADFDVFGQGVDTSLVDLLGGTTGQVLAKASGTDLDFVWSADAAGMVNPMTTTADIIYSSSGSTPARLGIGSTSEVLTVAAGLPTWAAAPTSSTSFTLLNSGGTALSGASTSVTVASYDKYYVRIPSALTSAATCEVTLVINSDTTANYLLLSYNWGNTYIDTLTSALVSPKSGVNMLQTPTSTSEPFNYLCEIYGGTSAGIKPFNSMATVGNTGRIPRLSKGYYKGTDAITNIAVYTSAGSFAQGSIFIYGSN